MTPGYLLLELFQELLLVDHLQQKGLVFLAGASDLFMFILCKMFRH